MALTIDFKDKIVLITGATSGIGLGIARMMAKAGCTVIGCAEQEETDTGASHFSREMAVYGGQSIYYKADMTLVDDIKTLVLNIEKQFGQLDILVSNAGKNIFVGSEACTEAEWQFNLDLNLSAHWRLARACKSLLEKKDGVIILMSSNHAFASIPGCFPYNVAKTALTGLVKSLAIEWGPSIRTVGLAPGFIETPGNQSWFNSFDHPDQERRRTIDLHPVKRLGTTEELGGWCVFLASEYAAFASGTTYLIDGGRSALMQDGF